jgi:predicted PurR-regulated permease PerM
MVLDKALLLRIVGIALLVFFIWKFSTLVFFIIIASIIGVVARPLMDLLGKVKIAGRRLPLGLSATLSMLTILMVIIGFVLLLMPIISMQANAFMSINYQNISLTLSQYLEEFEYSLKALHLLYPNESLQQMINARLLSFTGDIQISNLVNELISASGNVFMALFSILFMSFFFVRDEGLFQKIILLFVPEHSSKKTQVVLLKVKKLLTRYFIGLMIEVGSMMILISIGGLLLGIPNALLIGFIGGMLNLIPYLGPLIGASIGSVLTLVTALSTSNPNAHIAVLMVLGIFAVANLIDNFLLQPLIYSKSVNAHPLEIFLVIVIAGTWFGPLGMIAAIPMYTIVRITAQSFLSETDFIRRITKNI